MNRIELERTAQINWKRTEQIISLICLKFRDFYDEPGWQSAAELLTKDEARQIARVSPSCGASALSSQTRDTVFHRLKNAA